MGVEPYLVASAVVSVIAQRLVRRLCRGCRARVDPDTDFLRQAGFPVERLAGAAVYEAAGCETCRATGFHGRGGIFEVLRVTDAIQSLVIQRSSTNLVQQQAVSEGMCTLRDDGWIKVLDGFTTVEEVLRVTEETE
jgi:type II secretory ATPase GspE/PulE/Tfp pilus assembly ATPase PilB-like protein